MRRRLAAAAAAAALVLTGCAQQFDNEEGVVRDPDEVVIWTNVDQHPNIVYLCIDGLAWWTTTREFNAAARLPERDDHCARLR